MNYSKIHQSFQEILPDSNIFTFPEKYLGPNFETVLNYWWYLEYLSKPVDIDYPRTPSGYDLFLMREAKVLAPLQADAWYATQRGLNISDWYGWATVELICMHRILDEGKNIFYLPRIFNQ